MAFSSSLAAALWGRQPAATCARTYLGKAPPRAAFGSADAQRHTTAPATALRIALVLGSTRVEGPPFPANVGKRVGLFAARRLRERGHHVDVVDPVALKELLPLLEKPHFAYRNGTAPRGMDELADIFKRADAYVTVTPEYNHAPSPALLNVLNHFGSSIFSFKPSAIVAYSQGQWGGVRAAHTLRSVLSELGCLPVSAMMLVPHAHRVFDDEGNTAEPTEAQRWTGYSDRTWAQLEWWAHAARQRRAEHDPFEQSPSYQQAPSQRNAPISGS
ncbi:FMN-dependent NADPH-azoreductase [Porphyridium purpureum]|uniref:FMN-dependent NADPH-azoreductase n=1 Tax=Porphyridium purpureum TaxID=35688 RepID=A0A5J4Z0J3_PORPP|nr:FMN-dependent NADPH-azoreductase [Porphyridium purpureum]|eukprot:POR1936..scf208_2